MVISEVFWLPSRRWPIAVGSVIEGEAAAGDHLDVVSPSGQRRPAILRGVELTCRPGQPPKQGLTSLLLGDGLTPADLQPGDLVEARHPGDVATKATSL